VVTRKFCIQQIYGGSAYRCDAYAVPAILSTDIRSDVYPNVRSSWDVGAEAAP